MKLIVTKKGAELKHNNWKEGQLIKCSTPLAEMFIKNGFVIDQESTPVIDEEKVKTPKTKNK